VLLVSETDVLSVSSSMTASHYRAGQRAGRSLSSTSHGADRLVSLHPRQAVNKETGVRKHLAEPRH
jgi:hypothetical protein